MFIYDRPIEFESDDFLGRKGFASHLGQALLEWREQESLVIAMYGEWGSGKSSILNLAINDIKSSGDANIPTFIEFNPWAVSEENTMTKNFFTEIASGLSLQKDTKKDIALARKLKFYAKLLSLTPDKQNLSNISSKVFLLLSLFGISSSQILSLLNMQIATAQKWLMSFGILMLVTALIKEYILKLAELFDYRVKSQTISLSEMKKDIVKEISKRDKKLVIVIDDIDRLNTSEIRQMFRLIRVNADFPNTIYLLAFDRNIIEENLQEQVGVRGSDYLHKIVQVNFDVPFAKEDKIARFLFKELDRILDALPDSALKFFGQNNPYWSNIYNSGFKYFFSNIRDVKRFVSSLEFNISQMYIGEVMEVNPIDFIAVEAIRLFTPDFYLYMRDKKALFTSHQSDGFSFNNKDIRKVEIETALENVPEDKREHLTTLIKKLFPQLDGLLQHGNVSYGPEMQSTWSRSLQICAESNFDSYFTLIPGGDEQELSQYEIENVLNSMNSEEALTVAINELVDSGRVGKILSRIQDYVKDEERIPKQNVKNVIQVLFNLSDDLPNEEISMFGFGSDTDVMRIVYHLLKRNSDKNENYETLKKAITESVGLYGPIQKISLETPDKSDRGHSDTRVVSEERLPELQKLCVEKLKQYDSSKLLNHKELIYILYRWKEWDNEKNWEKFIEYVFDDDQKLMVFVNHFVSEQKSISAGDFQHRVKHKFDYKSLRAFTKLEKVHEVLTRIRELNGSVAEESSQSIDLFFSNYEKQDQVDDFDD